MPFDQKWLEKVAIESSRKTFEKSIKPNRFIYTPQYVIF